MRMRPDGDMMGVGGRGYSANKRRRQWSMRGMGEEWTRMMAAAGRAVKQVVDVANAHLYSVFTTVVGVLRG